VRCCFQVPRQTRVRLWDNGDTVVHLTDAWRSPCCALRLLPFRPRQHVPRQGDVIVGHRRVPLERVHSGLISVSVRSRWSPTNEQIPVHHVIAPTIRVMIRSETSRRSLVTAVLFRTCSALSIAGACGAWCGPGGRSPGVHYAKAGSVTAVPSCQARLLLSGAHSARKTTAL